MRKISIILIVTVVLLIAGGAFAYVQAQQSSSLTIKVNGESIVLNKGINVRPEIFEAARVPEFVSNNQWLLVDGSWDVMPKGASLPLELPQIVLLDGHPGLPAGHTWTEKNGWEIPSFQNLAGDLIQGEVTIEDGRTFGYSLVLPQNWAGIYENNAQGSAISFSYTGDPAMKHPIFTITALTEPAWQEAQKETGSGVGLIQVGEIIFAYNIALDNPFVGAQAEEFQHLAAQVGEIVATLVAIPTE